MTKTEERKIEKALIEKINKEEVGTDAHRKALQSLLEFQKQQEEIRKNLENERLEMGRQRDNARESVEKELIDKDKLRFEREKLAQETAQAQQNEILEKEKLEVQKKIEKRARLNALLCSGLGIIGTIISTIVGYKLFDKQAEKAYKFEETGTISSFTSRQVLSGLKPPRK